MARKPKKIPDEKQGKDGRIEKLEKRIKRLERERDNWKKKYLEATSTFRDAMSESKEAFGDLIKGHKVEEIIEASKDRRDLQKYIKEKKNDVKPVCSKCLSDNVQVSKIPIGTMIICKDCSHTEIKK